MSVALRMMQLFAGSESAHGTHGEPDAPAARGKCAIKSTARTLEGPATVDLWQQHLDGRTPLGVIPIRRDGSCLWGSIDVDEYDRDLLGLIAEVHRRKLPLVPCRSKSGGLHLFLFAEEAVSAAEVQSALSSAARTLGLKGAEVFPKQQSLAEDGVGNWMVMPYFGGTFGGKLREQVGVKKTGAEQNVEEFLRAAEDARVSCDQIRNLVGPNSPGVKEDDFADGPPCLQRLAATGFPAGSHNNALLMIGVYLKRAYPTGWQRRLQEANVRYELNQSADEVATLTRSLAKRDYEYTCKAVPMVDSCDSKVCRTRQHGVGGSADGRTPELISVVKIKSDTPRWLVTVVGSNQQVEIDDIRDLSRCIRFVDQCAAQLGLMFRIDKSNLWADKVNAVLTVAEVREPEEDTTLLDEFRELVEEFVTNRARGERKDDLLSGRPWEDEERGRHYFRIADLLKFLHRQSMRDIDRPTTARMIRKLGGDCQEYPMTLKGKNVRVWWVPSGAVHATPSLDPPPLKPEVV